MYHILWRGFNLVISALDHKLKTRQLNLIHA